MVGKHQPDAVFHPGKGFALFVGVIAACEADNHSEAARAVTILR
jgi:hypothetical protein